MNHEPKRETTMGAYTECMMLIATAAVDYLLTLNYTAWPKTAGWTWATVQTWIRNEV